jgi:hypothetical protein
MKLMRKQFNNVGLLLLMAQGTSHLTVGDSPRKQRWSPLHRMEVGFVQTFQYQQIVNVVQITNTTPVLNRPPFRKFKLAVNMDIALVLQIPNGHWQHLMDVSGSMVSVLELNPAI